MIELRWLERRYEAETGIYAAEGPIINGLAKSKPIMHSYTERVLQYRVKEATFNDSGVQTGYGWTDWRDVPTEAE